MFGGFLFFKKEPREGRFFDQEKNRQLRVKPVLYCGVWSYIFWIEFLFLAFVQDLCSKATFMITVENANVNKKFVVFFTTFIEANYC